MRYICRCRQIWDLLERDFPFYCICGFVAKTKEDMLVATKQTAPPPQTIPSFQCEPCKAAAQVAPSVGSQLPGTELKNILASIGIHPTPGCPCIEHMLQMDIWGPVRCKENRETIIHWLRMGYKSWGWSAVLKFAIATGRAVKTGLAFKLDPRDPFPGLVDEAIKQSLKPQENSNGSVTENIHGRREEPLGQQGQS